MPDTSKVFVVTDLDPQVCALHDAVTRQGLVSPDPLSMPLDVVRTAAERYHAFLNGTERPAARVDALTVAESADGPGFSLRLYRPAYAAGDAALPVLVYFHGGGFVVNSLDTHDRLLRLLAGRSGVAVAAVRYALAPERVFPHQHHQAVAAVRWIARHGAGQGLDPSRIAVGGDSAGANLALAAALALKNDAEARVSFGLLFYGMFAHDFDSVSHRRFGDGRYGLTTLRMRWYWKQYLGHGHQTRDPRAAPLLADLSGLPPLMLLAAGRDCLRDDSLRLAERLAESGVDHTLSVHDDLPHAFANMTRLVDAADRAVTAAADAVRRHLTA